MYVSVYLIDNSTSSLFLLKVSNVDDNSSINENIFGLEINHFYWNDDKLFYKRVKWTLFYRGIHVYSYITNYLTD